MWHQLFFFISFIARFFLFSSGVCISMVLVSFRLGIPTIPLHTHLFHRSQSLSSLPPPSLSLPLSLSLSLSPPSLSLSLCHPLSLSLTISLLLPRSLTISRSIPHALYLPLYLSLPFSPIQSPSLSVPPSPPPPLFPSTSSIPLYPSRLPPLSIFPCISKEVSSSCPPSSPSSCV